MKIAQVGKRFTTIPQIDYFSRQTFLEYDAIIIDISTIGERARDFDTTFFANRKSNLIDFISFKKMPIIYLAPRTDEMAVIENGARFSRRVSTLLPVPTFVTEEEGGNEFNITPKTPFSDFFEKYKSWFGYKRYYIQYLGTPVVVTPYTNKVLAFYTENSVFLPQIVSYNAEQEKEFLYVLVESIKSVRFDPNDSPLPKWTESYFLPGEFESKQKVNHLHKQIEQLKLEVEKLQSEIEIITEKKRLFTASGDELEIKVEAIFSELGFEILQAEKNRDDLIVKYGEDVAVVEIKGLSHSAGEKNAAQLEKWRATYLEIHGVNPKGILLVNTYREMPLAERNQPDFPEQMLRYVIGREHCLITTVQLLALYYETVKKPESKETIIKSLFETVGRYTDNFKWQNFIKIAES